MSLTNTYNDKIIHYKNNLTGTGYLALRDIPHILKEQIQAHNNALDFGCGAGRSSRFLQKLGFSVVGVDSNSLMLESAKNYPNNSIQYHHMTHAIDLLILGKFDLIFNLFVLFEFNCKKSLIEYLSCFKKMLGKGGTLVSIVNSDHLFTRKWISISNHYPENKNLSSGCKAKISLPLQGNISLYDYYWTEQDYYEMFKLAGFESISKYKPLGNIDDPYLWLDEYDISPYCIYITR